MKKGSPKSLPQARTASGKALLHGYREMLRARLCDEKTITLYKQNKCHFQIGPAGHEAIGAAFGQIFRAGHDWFYPYYRDHALCTALGMSSLDFMLNAMNKADDPNSHGRQMPAHFGSKALRIVNQSSPTGTQFLQAVGCALACKKLGVDEVVYVSAGEGACAQGDFHEAVNWACLERLPVVFVIHNNEFAISVPLDEQIAGGSLFKLTAGYANLARRSVDGTDFPALLDVAKELHDLARKGAGPCLVEAAVPRLQSHSISDNHLKYRSETELKKDRERDPLPKLRSLLIARKIVSAGELDEIAEEIKAEIDRDAERAEQMPDCDQNAVEEHIYQDPHPSTLFSEREPTGQESYLVDAINHALDEELARNPQTYIFGEDVAHGKGGVFTVTNGLTAKYGVERVFNSPLAESSIVGVAIGMATRGLRPIPEIQFGDYIWTAMMQLRNELAMMRYRSGGDFSAPVVVRVPVGGYIRGGCYHSQNIEATFAHFPGLFIAYPSNASDAKGLLKAALRMSDPVLFLEHKGLYRMPSGKGPEGDADHVVPFGRARVCRNGRDLTIVTWGYLVQRALQLAKRMADAGEADIEVIDLRTIVPLDTEAIFTSIRKTNRCVIAHEDVWFGGFGGEIAAQVAEHCFASLDAPVRRLGMRCVPAVPHGPVLEEVVLPQDHDLERVVREVLAF